jgi:hypothetical protein
MPVGGYASRFGDGQGGGGYANWAYADPLNAGHYIIVGDVWGPRYTLDGANTWHANGRGLPASNTWPNGRSCMISKRAATSGLEFYAFGSAHGGENVGGLYASPMGSGDMHLIDGTNGFGQSGYGGTGPGTGPNGEAVRPNGQLIESIMVSGTEYIFTITPTGLHRYTNAGTSWSAITSEPVLAAASRFPGTDYAVSMLAIDSNHLYVGLWDHSPTGVLQNSRVYLVTSSAANLGVATSGQITVTEQTPANINHIYHAKKGKDGLFHVGCGFDGAYQITLSGGNLVWTKDVLATGSPSPDVVVASVDADTSGKVWMGQVGAGADFSTQNNTPAGHNVIQGALSAGHYTYTFPATGSAVNPQIFQAGDGATASGPSWFLFGNGPT